MFTCAGALQVAPPSLDVESTTAEPPLPANRESCHTTYSCPVAGLIAGSGMSSPVRDGAGGVLVSGSTFAGSTTSPAWSELITCGEVQVAPPSAEDTNATFSPRCCCRFDLFWMRSKKL